MLLEVAQAEVDACWQGEPGNKLQQYIALLVSTGQKHNLVGNTEPDFVRNWLIGESIASWIIAQKPSAFMDVGSGAGLPGVVWAILASGREGTRILVESRAKRAAFLRWIAGQLQLELRVIEDRVENLDLAASVVTSRAVFRPDKVLTALGPSAEHSMVLSGGETEPDSVEAWELGVCGIYRWQTHVSYVRTYHKV